MRAGGCAVFNYPFLTSKERDNETGLDYFLARYYSSTQGRFTSADLPFMDQWPSDPQSWNLYSYVRNNPLAVIDPTGNAAQQIPCDEACQDSKRKAEESRKEAEAEGTPIDVTEIDELAGIHRSELGMDLDTILERRFIGTLKNANEYYAYRCARENGGVCGVMYGDLMLFGSITKLGGLLKAAPEVKLLGTAGMNLLNAAKDSKLRNLVKDLYKPTAKIGNGSTADVIRYERATGILMSTAGHSIKGREYLGSLQGLVRGGRLSPQDRAIAQEIIIDLKDALK